MKKEISIVGCGKVGTALAVYLGRKGYDIAGISCRTETSLKRASDVTGARKSHLDPGEIAGQSGIVFLAVPDGDIKKVCEDLSERHVFQKHAVIFHLSGALSSEILSPAAGTCVTGSLHPLQSFAVLDIEKNPFQGIIMSAEGDPTAVKTARMITEDLGAHFAEIKTESKILYHAAAVVSSNYLVTVMDFALSLMKKTGLPDKEAFQLLKPLITGTLSNIEKNGTVSSLTGPISRGDLSVIENHISGIDEKSSHFSELYRMLGKYTVDIAEKSKTLNDQKIKALKKALL